MALDAETEARDEPRLSEWESRAEWPLIGTAVVFLIAYSWQVLQISAPAWLANVLEALIWITWIVFAVEYAVRLLLARRKWRFLKRNVFDLLTVLLPLLRPLRAVRLLIVVRVLNRRVRGSLRGKVGVYVSSLTALVGYCAALAVYDAERAAPDSNIQSFPDALWWVLTTLTTVGYGDHYPTTWEGKLVAAALMVGGIALLGTMTGMIATWFLERFQGAEESMQAETDSLRREIERLREVIAAARPGADGTPGHAGEPGLFPEASRDRATSGSSRASVEGTDG